MKYMELKKLLKAAAVEAKKIFKNDIPAINMTINDTIDFLAKEHNLSERQRHMLALYGCTLHC
jgi:hypothetical protein